MYTRKYSQDVNINNPEKYHLTENIVWSSPQGFDLTLDIYSPKEVPENCPVVVMFHGGGFLIRRKEILNNMSQYIATNHDWKYIKTIKKIVNKKIKLNLLKMFIKKIHHNF